jgi:hypothetical protein
MAIFLSFIPSIRPSVLSIRSPAKADEATELKHHHNLQQERLVETLHSQFNP